MLAFFFLSLGLLTTLGWTSPVPKITNDTVLQVAIKDCGRSIYDCARNTFDRIVGGRYAYRGEFPWMVSIRERDSLGWEHVCGAAILNEYWVVSAAHCFDSTSTRMYDIVVGLHKLNEVYSSSTAKVHKLSKIILHSGYDSETNVDDIALMKTVLPIDFKKSKGYITGVCLPEPGSDPRGTATVSGWGHTVEDGDNSNTLKTVDVPLVDRTTCNDRYDENPFDNIDDIRETMICAGSRGRDSCQNDSGGPLVQYDDANIATLIGIVSFGTGCGDRYYPGVYTRVSSYLKWIQRNAV